MLPLVVLAMLAIWLITSMPPASGRANGTNGGTFFSLWVLAISLLLTPALDFLCISSALNSVSSEVSAGRWDLLRLTLLRPNQIVAAKHGAAQVRAWRFMILLIGVRVAAFLMVAFNLFRSPYFVYTLYGRGFGDPFFGNPLLAVLAIGVFALEPLWRTSALTALGVAISTRVEHRGSVVLLAVVAAIAFWIGELLIIMLLAVLIPFFDLNLLNRTFAPASWFALTNNGLLVSLFVALFYGYLAFIQYWSLHHAVRQIARAN